MKLLVVATERASEREQRREAAGRSADETYAATLEQLAPGAEIVRITPADSDDAGLGRNALEEFDGVFLTGSPLHVNDGATETERLLIQARTLMDAGVPVFGSCAGLQVMVAALGGEVGSMGPRREAGAVRGIVATAEGRDHPLLAGRPGSWDALSIHDDEVTALPKGGVRLAGNAAAHVQAVEIRSGDGLFWGVQYHPELAPDEIAIALRGSAEDFVEAGIAEDEDAVEALAAQLDRLHDDPDDAAALWRAGLTSEATHEDRRRLELRNFLDTLVRPRAAGREGTAEPADAAAD